MAAPQTRILGGTGSSVASYRLPPGVFQYIQSVLVEVDTGGSGDVQPTLEVATSDGVVMAAQQQGRAITGGGSGRATWALRLGDEQGVGSLNPQTIKTVGAFVSGNAASYPSGGGGNIAVFDAIQYDTDNMVSLGTQPTRVTVKTAGFYQVLALVTWTAETVANTARRSNLFHSPVGSVIWQSTGLVPTTTDLRLETVGFFSAAVGTYFRISLQNYAPAARTAAVQMLVTMLSAKVPNYP